MFKQMSQSDLTSFVKRVERKRLTKNKMSLTSRDYNFIINGQGLFYTYNNYPGVFLLHPYLLEVNYYSSFFYDIFYSVSWLDIIKAKEIVECNGILYTLNLGKDKDNTPRIIMEPV